MGVDSDAKKNRRRKRHIKKGGSPKKTSYPHSLSDSLRSYAPISKRMSSSGDSELDQMALFDRLPPRG